MTPPTLIVIDWQCAFRDDGRYGLRNNPHAEANAGRLLAHWRQMGWPIVHVRHDSVLPDSPLRPGLPGNAVEAFAVEQSGELVVRKNVNSAFVGTGLAHRLAAAGQKDLVFCGVTTDHCVSTSVRSASDLGFRPIVVGDACFTHARGAFSAEAMHETALASLSGEFAAVVDTAAALAQKPGWASR